MQETWGTCPEDLMVAFGPHIRVCCYEVGEECAVEFPKEVVARGNTLYLDLSLVNKEQLVGLGVLAQNISGCNTCTCCNDRFFSYRREGEKAGRHLSLIMI